MTCISHAQAIAAAVLISGAWLVTSWYFYLHGKDTERRRQERLRWGP